MRGQWSLMAKASTIRAPPPLALLTGDTLSVLCSMAYRASPRRVPVPPRRPSVSRVDDPPRRGRLPLSPASAGHNAPSAHKEEEGRLPAEPLVA